MEAKVGVQSKRFVEISEKTEVLFKKRNLKDNETREVINVKRGMK